MFEIRSFGIFSQEEKTEVEGLQGLREWSHVLVYVCFPNNIINGISFCSLKYLHQCSMWLSYYNHLKKEREENCWWDLVRSNGLEWCQALGLFTGPSSDLVSDPSPLQLSMYPLFISYLPTLTTASLPTLFFPLLTSSKMHSYFLIELVISASNLPSS